jgi:hypothetical protein
MVDSEQLPLAVQIQMGTLVCLLHTFTCLHHKGVISLTDAAQSFDATEKALPPNMSQVSRLVVSQMARSLQMLADQKQSPNPAGPPAPTRPNLQVIQGGKTD